LLYRLLARAQPYANSGENWVLKGSGEEIQALVFRDDGEMLAGGGRTVVIWDLKTDQILRSLPGHVDWVAALAWAPDRKRLATGSLDSTVRVWNVPKGH
jgi:WD40 repeat protein